MFANPEGFVSGDSWRDNDWLNTRAFDLLASEALLEEGEFPLRSPYVGGGFPTLAHPSDGSWAPTLIPILVFGNVLGTKLLVLLFLFLGALGVYLLGRDQLQLRPESAGLAAVLMLVSGWLPSMLLVGFWNQVFYWLVPLVAWCLWRQKPKRHHLLVAAGLLFLALQQGGHAFSATVFFLAAAGWIRGAARTSQLRIGAASALALLLSLALARVGGLWWAPILGVFAAIWLLRSTGGRELLRDTGPELRALAIAIGGACLLGAGRIAGLIYLGRAGAEYGHSLDRTGALWFPREGTHWAFPSPDVLSRGSIDFRGGRFYEGITTFLDTVVHRVPSEMAYRTQFGRPGPPMDHEYAWLGLGVVGLLLALVGVFAARREPGTRALVLWTLWIAAVCCGWSLPPDVHFLTVAGVPLVGDLAQPIKYFNFFLLLGMVLLAGLGAQRVLDAVPDGLGRRGTLLLLLLLALQPSLSNRQALEERFSEARPPQPHVSRFEQVGLINELSDASLDAETIEQRAKDRHLREFRRPAAATEYDLAPSGVGVVSWYGTLRMKEHAIPARWVTPEGKSEPNPNYRGEAWFSESESPTEARVGRSEFRTNEVHVEVRGAEVGDVLVINQEVIAPAHWSSDRGGVVSVDGLLALKVTQGGDQTLVLRYRPALLLAGLGVSALAFILWLGLLLPRRLWFAASLGGALLWFLLPRGPAVQPQVRWAPPSPPSLTAGEPTLMNLELVAGSRGLRKGTELRVGYPHWVYGARGVEPPKEAESHGFGHWYIVRQLQSDIGPAEVTSIPLPAMPVPQSAGPGFAPMVWLDWDLLDGPEPLAIKPEAPARLVVVAPSFVAPGTEFEVGVRLEDRWGNPAGVPPSKQSVAAIEEPGVHRVERVIEYGGETFVGSSNPFLVEAGGPRLAWVDLHGHSALSDGRGTPQEWYAHARDIAFLDGAALSDHDWQLEDDEWEELLKATDLAEEPGRFATLRATETNVHGHEVAYFIDAPKLEARVRGSIPGARTIWEETDLRQPGAVPTDILTELDAQSVVLATHTSLASNMGTGFPLSDPHPGHRLLEVYSAHGSSECQDCPRRVGGGELSPGEEVSSVQDALDAGFRGAFLAAGDSHDGHPGTSSWGGHRGGLTALEVNELSRAGLLDALQSGRSYATSGERTILQTEWEARAVRFRVLADTDIEAVEVVADGGVSTGRLAKPEPGVWLRIDNLPATDWRYLRVILPNGARAWSSPWFSSSPDSPKN